MNTKTVEILITVGQNADASLSEGEIRFTGEYLLRALDEAGTVLCESHVTLPELRVTTSDYARLVTLGVALERLRGKLHGETAEYALRVIQSSANVDGWRGAGSAIRTWSRSRPASWTNCLCRLSSVSS